MSVTPKAGHELFHAALDAITELQKLARSGDDEAARALWQTAAQCNSKLSLLLPKPGPLLRAEIERSPCCPCNFPANRKARENLVADLARLGLGKNCEVNATGKFDSQAPMSKAVGHVYFDCLRPLRENPNHPGPRMSAGKQIPGWNEWAQANAAKIPQNLTRENAREWADLAAPLLAMVWGENFEEHSFFALYKESAAWKRKREAGARAGTLRGELLRMWRQSWKSLANP